MSGGRSFMRWLLASPHRPWSPPGRVRPNASHPPASTVAHTTHAGPKDIIPNRCVGYSFEGRPIVRTEPRCSSQEKFPGAVYPEERRALFASFNACGFRFCLGAPSLREPEPESHRGENDSGPGANHVHILQFEILLVILLSLTCSLPQQFDEPSHSRPAAPQSPAKTPPAPDDLLQFGTNFPLFF